MKAALSQYFNAMFSGRFKESTETAFEIEDIKPNTFKALIRFVYTNRLNSFEGIDVEELLVTADKY